MWIALDLFYLQYFENVFHYSACSTFQSWTEPSSNSIICSFNYQKFNLLCGKLPTFLVSSYYQVNIWMTQSYTEILRLFCQTRSKIFFLMNQHPAFSKCSVARIKILEWPGLSLISLTHEHQTTVVSTWPNIIQCPGNTQYLFTTS